MTRCPAPQLRRVTTVLCLTQIISWGVLYYALPTLAPSISADTGWSSSFVSACFSAALIAQAAGSYRVGRIIDQYGPRAIMTAGSVLGTGAMVVVATAPSRWVFMLGWVLAGIAMSATLYAPAFAALTRWWGTRRLTGLTILTLVAGFASTVFAPVSVALTEAYGWRNAYLLMAAFLGLSTIPLHYLGLAVPWPEPEDAPPSATTDSAEVRRILRSPSYVALVAAFVLAALSVFASIFAMVPLFLELGHSQAAGAWALGLSGAGQVLGRLVYGRITRRWRLRTRTAVITAATVLCIGLLGVIPGPLWLLVAVALTGGLFRGLYTLLQATAMVDRYSSAYYGRLNGAMTPG